MATGGVVPGSLYIYAPNKGAPVFFNSAFAASGGIHIWQCYHYKCFKLMWLYPFTAFIFTAGFALREYGAFHYEDLSTYLASICLIYFAPPILELANYHILGRILYYVPYFAPLHPGRVLTTFGAVSAVVEVLNAVGVTYSAWYTLPSNLISLGRIMLKASLVLQLLVIGSFYCLAAFVHWRCIRVGFRNRKVHIPFIAMYISTFLILTRTIYRTVEHFGASSIHAGPDFDPEDLSPILRHEWFFYVFEATLMLTNSILWNVLHPRRYLPRSHRTYLTQDGVTELAGPGWKDKRSFWITVLDSCGLCIPQKHEMVPFWENNGYAWPRPGRAGGERTGAGSP